MAGVSSRSLDLAPGCRPAAGSLSAVANRHVDRRLERLRPVAWRAAPVRSHRSFRVVRAGGAPGPSRPAELVAQLARPKLTTAAVLAALGVADTAYLTATAGAAFCPTSGCVLVLTSDYASVFGVPLPAVGLVAYAATLVLATSAALAPPTEPPSTVASLSTVGLQAVTGALAASGVYFLYVMGVALDAWCPYCLCSVAISFLLFAICLEGGSWKANSAGALAAAAFLALAAPSEPEFMPPPPPTASSSAPPTAASSAYLLTPSSPEALRLASHLREIGARFYGAFWCTHCAEQKELLGAEAFAMLEYVECDARGANGVPDVCKERGVKGYPTWEINGELHAGVKPLEELARISGLGEGGGP